MPLSPDADLSVVLYVRGLCLRPCEDADATAIAVACADPEIARWVPVPVPYGEDDARSWMVASAAQQEARTSMTRAVVDPANGRLLGMVGLHDLANPIDVELGYWVAPWARRQGVIRRAADAVAGWALMHGAQRVRVLVEPANEASLRAAIAAGFHREGVLRGYGRARDGRPVDMVLLSRLPSDPAPPR